MFVAWSLITQSKWKMNLEGGEPGGPLPAGNWAITLWPGWPGGSRGTPAFSSFAQEAQEILPRRLLVYLSCLLGMGRLSHSNMKTCLLGCSMLLRHRREEELIYRISATTLVLQQRALLHLDCQKQAFLHQGGSLLSQSPQRTENILETFHYSTTCLPSSPASSLWKEKDTSKPWSAWLGWPGRKPASEAERVHSGNFQIKKNIWFFTSY